MSKKPELEILMKERFNVPSPYGGMLDAELRLKRKGTKFYVEKSCFVGEYALHVESYDDVTLAYEEYNKTFNKYKDYIK